MSGGDGDLRARRVVERLAEKSEIDRTGLDRRILDPAEAVFEIRVAVFAGDFGAVFNHLLRIVDRDDLLRPLGEKLGKGALTRAEIGDHERWHQFQERLTEGFPRASRAIGAAEFTREVVEVGAGLVAAFQEDELERGGIVGGLRHL